MKNRIAIVLGLISLSLISCITVHAQAKKPTLMVIPSNVWCVNNGYVQTFNDQGTTNTLPDYEAALTLPKNGKQKEALAAFDSFTKRYPSGNFTAGAHFWAGNAALQSKDLASATRHFKTVTDKWPSDNVAPDAMLGLANSQQALGDATAARNTLKSLTERYPQSNAAQVARQRLATR